MLGVEVEEKPSQGKKWVALIPISLSWRRNEETV
jgi:hypothetical protein